MLTVLYANDNNLQIQHSTLQHISNSWSSHEQFQTKRERAENIHIEGV